MSFPRPLSTRSRISFGTPAGGFAEVNRLQTRLPDALSAEDSVVHLRARLHSEYDNIKRQSKIIRDQNNLGNQKIRDINSSNQTSIEHKDAEILDLNKQLAAEKKRNQALLNENSILRKERNVVTKTASGLTPAKTAAMVNSGEQLTKRAEVLEALNKKYCTDLDTAQSRIAELEKALREQMPRMEEIMRKIQDTQPK